MKSDYMPMVVCNSDNIVILSEPISSDIPQNIKIKDDVTKFLASESKTLLSKLSNGEYALAKLRGLGNYKYAVVKNQIYLGFGMKIFLLLPYGASEIAEFISCGNLPEHLTGKKLLSAVEFQKQCDKAFSESEIYEHCVALESKLAWCAEKLSFSKTVSEDYRFADFIRELSESVSPFYLNGCNLKIVYGEGITDNLPMAIESSAFYTVMILLISLAADSSCNKEIVLSSDYFENRYVFKISTEIENNSGELCRDRDIYDFSEGQDINSQMAAVCARLFGASNAKLSKSVDGADGKYYLSFECVKKEYEKMPAGVKTDTDTFDADA